MTKKGEVLTEQDSTTDRANRLRKAYTNATTRLRESRREEFDALYAEEAQKLGVDYTPRPTAEQKAEQEFDALLAAYPHLANKIGQPV